MCGPWWETLTFFTSFGNSYQIEYIIYKCFKNSLTLNNAWNISTQILIEKLREFSRLINVESRRKIVCAGGGESSFHFYQSLKIHIKSGNLLRNILKTCWCWSTSHLSWLKYLSRNFKNWAGKLMLKVGGKSSAWAEVNLRPFLEIHIKSNFTFSTIIEICWC